MKTKIKIKLAIICFVVILAYLKLSFSQNQIDDFTTSKEGEFILSNRKYYLLENTKVDFEKGEIILEPTKSGVLRINNQEFNIKYDKDNPPKFILDKDGKIITGTKFTTQEGKFELRDYIVNLPENSVVEYLEDRIVITAPVSSEIIPNVRDSKNIKWFLEIKTKEPGFLKIQGGNIQSLKEISPEKYEYKETKIFYEYKEGKLRTYFEDKAVNFLNDKGELDFRIINNKFGTNDPKVYLVYDEKDLVKNMPNVMIKNDRIGTFNYQGKGPIIEIGKGNRIGAGLNKEGGNDLSDEKTLSFQSDKGFAILNKFGDERIPVLQISGNSIYGPDQKSFFVGYYAITEEDYIRHKPESIIEGVNHGEGTVALVVHPFDDNGKRMPYDLFVNNENEYWVFGQGRLNDPLKYGFGADKYEADILFSSGVSFNQMSPERKIEFSQLSEETRKNLVKNFLKTGGTAALEKELERIYSPSKDIFTRASVDVTVEDTGGSGTLVGIKDDKVYVLTAAHVVDKKGKISENFEVYLTSQNNKYLSTKKYNAEPINGKIVAFSKRSDFERKEGGEIKFTSPKNLDLALLELTPTSQQLEEVKKRGFIKIAPHDFDLSVGDEVVMVGCQRNIFYVRGCRITSISETTGTDSLSVDKSPYYGMSGGGLFKDKYLVGVVQSGVQVPSLSERSLPESFGTFGGFGNLESIYTLLGDKYEFLYKMIILIIKRG